MHEGTLKLRVPMREELAERILSNVSPRVTPIEIMLTVIPDRVTYNVTDKSFGGLWLEADMRVLFPVSVMPECDAALRERILRYKDKLTATEERLAQIVTGAALDVLADKLGLTRRV